MRSRFLLGGQRYIHTNYLGWIHNLVVDIQANLIMFGN
jgi:hypothetical protein